MAAQLNGIAESIPLLLGSVIALLAAVALTAAAVPAHRAARIEPMDAMRST